MALNIFAYIPEPTTFAKTTPLTRSSNTNPNIFLDLKKNFLPDAAKLTI